MIIGTAGTFGAGKDEVSRYLEQKGFQHISTSNLLREKVLEMGLETSFSNLFTFSNKLSSELGDDFLARWSLEKVTNNKVVISGLRKPGEIDLLKSKNGFRLIFVDAPVEVRFARIKSRKREGEEELTLEQFRQKEALELRGDTGVQNILYCKEKADYIIDNSNSLDDLHRKIDLIMEEINDKEN